MSQKEILYIAIKVLSLWFLCQVFLHVSSVLPFFLSTASIRLPGKEIPTWAYIAICLSFFVAGAIISQLLFSISNSALDKLSSDTDIFLSETGQKFILQISGLFFIITSLTWLPSSFSFLFTPQSNEFHWQYYFAPLRNLFQISIGLWLIIHPNWWIFLLSKFRGGNDKPSKEVKLD